MVEEIATNLEEGFGEMHEFSHSAKVVVEGLVPPEQPQM
jgi:hypothetical protein